MQPSETQMWRRGSSSGHHSPTKIHGSWSSPNNSARDNNKSKSKLKNSRAKNRADNQASSVGSGGGKSPRKAAIPRINTKLGSSRYGQSMAEIVRKTNPNAIPRVELMLNKMMKEYTTFYDTHRNQPQWH